MSPTWKSSKNRPIHPSLTVPIAFLLFVDDLEDLQRAQDDRPVDQLPADRHRGVAARFRLAKAGGDLARIGDLVRPRREHLVDNVDLARIERGLGREAKT